MKTPDLITYIALSAFSGIIRRLQLRTRYHSAYYIYLVLYKFVPLRKSLALRNIRRAYPDMTEEWYERTLKRSYRFFARSFIEFFALPASYTQGDIQVKGRDIIDRAVKGGTGVILVAGHMGPWEIMAAWLGYNKYRFTGIAQRQRNKGADKFFSEKRGESGVLHIFRKSGFRKMYEVLERGDILGVAIDQDARKKGVIIDFFSLPVSAPKGAAIFHQNTKAPIVFVNICETSPYKYRIEFFPVDTDPSENVETITQKFTKVMERAIIENPEQYFWFHNKFKTTRKLLNDKKN